MQDLLISLRALGAGRLIAMAAVGVSVLALLAILVLRGGGEHMALLYGDLDLKEAGQMADLLEHQHISVEIGRQGSEILVPETQVARARMLLAREGLPSGGAIGYEIFDRSDSLVASQFQQTINETRALEGELARTIRTMQGVRNARVHVVLPRREPFATSQQDAQASVLLTLSGANRLDHESVQAILTLVAAAVPGLRPQNIAVVDTHGSLLARARSSADGPGGTELDELRRSTELRLSRAVEEMLESSLGIGHVRAEAAVEMDFDQVRETQEKFDPEGQVVRGTQTSSDTNKTTEPSATTTVANNLPNADANGGNGAGSQEQKQDETTNYEIGKTVRTLVRDHPQIHRISLAVMIDGVDVKDDKGVTQWKPRAPEDIERIATLVRSAIGYDEKRGDHVDVVSMRFAAEDAGAVTTSLWPGNFEKADMMRLSQTALLGILGILSLLFVLRPMVARITQTSDSAMQSVGFEAAGGGDLRAIGAGQQLMLGGAQGGTAAMAGPGGQAAIGYDGAEQTMVNMQNVEGALRASSLRKLVELVNSHPEESLTIVRAWMQQEAS